MANLCKAQESGENWTIYNGDCVDVLSAMPDNSVDFTMKSPPFKSLYTYSNSDRDMGNCRTSKEFYGGYKFVVDEMYRVTKPGRIVAFHCMDLPTSKQRDGFIGVDDFSGELIQCYKDAGFIQHTSRITIWKDPVTAMQRTKALGLLYKQIKKDSAMSRPGMPDYLIAMRKPGVNAVPIGHMPEDFPVDLWQRIASPVWVVTSDRAKTELDCDELKMDSDGFATCHPDIDQSNTLQKMREEKDERHICPLQLEVIHRANLLWSNPGDAVLSPFAGIGSEGYESILMGRKFVGVELKTAYYNQAIKNLRSADQRLKEKGLF